ncbi:hypothetical protein P9869_13870 [Streptomyces ossamyceticus]|nr:hypothetical protein [Streptomyces ossamyceticus]
MAAVHRRDPWQALPGFHGRTAEAQPTDASFTVVRAAPALASPRTGEPTADLDALVGRLEPGHRYLEVTPRGPRDGAAAGADEVSAGAARHPSRPSSVALRRPLAVHDGSRRSAGERERI